MKKLLAILILFTNLGLAAYETGSNYQQAPLINVKTMSGESFVLKDFIGKKPVYLKFWATWCTYCKAEMPHLQTLEDKHGDKIEIVTINVGLNDSVDNINSLFSTNDYTLNTVFDTNGDITSKYGVVGTPHHVLIDKEGNIVYRTFLVTDALDEIVAQWAKGE